jgi:hypothetical protein
MKVTRPDSRPIHIEGMGVLGCLLAHRLAEARVPFTWDDTEAPFTAWKACTGMVYPSGSSIDETCRMRWLAWLTRDTNMNRWAQSVPWVFAHKAPPHGGRYETQFIGSTHLQCPASLRERAIAVNVPRMVRETRLLFADQRDVRRKGATLVVCHSTPKRTDGYLWGWATTVTLKLHPDLGYEPLRTPPPALYAKAHRFNITYAYPLPGTAEAPGGQLWWAGSRLQLQRTPKVADRDLVDHYFLEWAKNMRSLLLATPVTRGMTVQGWRPRPPKRDRAWARRDAETDTWQMPSMATDGLRRGLLVVDDVLVKMGIARADQTYAVEAPA